tara:strand:+ start:37 stop:582 length:546 start_codon:yes stop_codon:yes gene_type:complete
MAISSSEIKLIYSGALASNTNANDSFGGQISTAAGGIITSNVLNNDMDDITSAEAASGITIYHAYYYKNTNSTLTYIAPKIYIESNTGTNETESYIGVPPELKNVSVQRLSAETGSGSATPPVDPPTSVTFSSPGNYAAGLALLDLPTTNYRGIWVKYVVDASASAVLDEYTLGIQGDSNP